MTTKTGNLPALSGENGLQRYMQEIRQAHKLVTSHLRLVAKIAMGYRGYGLPIGK
jgi:DNA-directed RNA polymerase sigma subunit (sigma70/sigma32)